jgi:hydrophobic/amphiphilic exporter-1 (mainly G- bacteria), HAE1 family
MKLVDFSTSRRVTVGMLMVAIIAFGIVGFSRLSVNLLPDITYPTLTVRTQYEGVGPQEMERLISEPVEGLVGVVSNVVSVSSVSRPGLSDVVVEFAWGTDMDFASLDVREKLDLANLPRDAGKPVLLRFDPSLDPVLRVALYGGSTLLELRRLAEERIRLALESLEGVAAVRIEGGLEEEIQVEVETTRLAYLGIPISQVTSRLADENVNLTGGMLKDGEAEFLVRTLNEFGSIEDIGDIVIDQVGDAALKLKDLGRVTRGHKERDIITRINGREGVEISIFKEGDANTVQVSKAVVQKLAEFEEENRSLLGDGKMEIVFNQATFIEQAVDEVLDTAILGGILAVIVLFLFLRDLKATSIIGLSIPISVVATFFFMFSSEVSLNIMSLGGLALGVGMLVDNSIVVLESVQRYRERGMAALEAARKGSSEVGSAVIAATMTTICVFVPIVFVEGVAGQLFRDQALTVTYSLVASLIVALMLIPMLSSLSLNRMLAEDGAPRPGVAVRGPAYLVRWIGAAFKGVGWLLGMVLKPLYWVFDSIYGALAAFYPKVLSLALRQRLVVLVLCTLLAGLILERARYLGVELIPEMGQGEFLIDLEWPAGAPLASTANLVSGIDYTLGQLEGVDLVFSLVGTGGSSGGAASEKKENMAQLLVRLDGEGVGEKVVDEKLVVESARAVLADVPDLKFKFSKPSYFSFRTPIEVEISGYSLSTLEILADDVAQRLRSVPGLVDVKSSAEGGQPEIQVVFNRLRVAEIGTTIQAIGALLRNKLQGDVATELTRQDRKIDIRVRAAAGERRNLADLKQLIVSPPSYPVPVPLEAVAEVTVVDGPAEIRRMDQERVALVSANLSGRDLGSAVADVEAAIRQMPLPEGFSIDIGGQNEEMVRSFDSMKFALGLAVFLVYLVMASQFESLLHPLVIMSTIPLGLIGSVLALILTGQTISVVVLIGLIMLAGIVVNNAIVLVDHINHLRRAEGMAKMDAVLNAGILRFRPILMTTATTVLGLLPMALGLGQGSEIRAPMAITVIGGLLFSTILTLVLVPVVYTSLDRGK